MPIFPFVQFEFTHSIGPPPGRYIVHPRDRNGSEHFAAGGGDVPGPETPEEEIEARLTGTADVIVVQVRGAQPPSPRRWRPGLPKAPDGAPPAELSVMLVTVILATRLIADAHSAERGFSRLRGSEEEQAKTIGLALDLLRKCVSAYRLAAADPYVPDVSPLDARAARIGYGDAAMVVRGRWTEAFGVKPPRPPRLDRMQKLMPVQAMAAMLNGSMATLEAEELLLGALRDLDHGRHRAAAMTVNAAQELLLAELAGQELPGKVAPLLAKLEASRETARQLARRAVMDQLSPRDTDSVRQLAEDAGALIDAWRYVPLGFG